MVKIIFRKHNGVYFGFSEVGHAGYDEAGKDVVCAALSAMTMLIINTAEVVYAADVDYQMDEKTADITVSCKAALPGFCKDEKTRFAVAGLFHGYYLQLMDMLEEYYDYIDVEEEEVERP